MKETGVPWENHQSDTSHWQTDSIVLYRLHIAMSGIRIHSGNDINVDKQLSAHNDFSEIASIKYVQLIS
jgi:hypothetical protein